MSPTLFRFIFIIPAIIIVVFIIKISIDKDFRRQQNFLLVEYKNPTIFSEIPPVRENLVLPYVYEQVPGLTMLETEERKTKFIEILLPSILIVKHEIFKERKRTLEVREKLKNNYRISYKDSMFMYDLFEKYETKNFAEINLKQQVHPNSIIIAQAAVETGWGQSRFFTEGNNAFGIWSFNRLDDRMESLATRNELKIYLRKYDHILESTVDYFNIIARSWAFNEFRKRRAETDNSYELIWYLNKYSELRNDYVKKLGELMIQNQLTMYDSCRLRPDYFIKVNR